jgi:phospholipid/cholesterol/gamma-HCH transport system permease protein
MTAPRPTTQRTSTVRHGHSLGEDLARGCGLLLSRGGLPPAAWRQVPLQFRFTAVDAIPFTVLLAVATAAALVVQIRAIGLDEPTWMGSLLATVVVRELGPLLAALVVVARSGTAIATEMALLTVGGEARAMRLAGIDPFRYLVVPRLAGVALALLCVGHLFILATLVATHLFLNWMSDAPVGLQDYLHLLSTHLATSDLALVGLKLAGPGLLIAAICCHAGRRCAAVLTAVPAAVSQAVVRSFVAVVVWDALITWAWT